MPPVWFWIVMVIVVIFAIMAIIFIERLMKKDMEEFVEALELSNRVSKAKCFDICKREL